MTKLWIMKTWRQKIWFIGICGHPKRVRGLETKEAHFRSIPPLLWAQKIHPSYELHPKFYENYSDQLYSRRGKNPIYIQTDSFQGWKFQMVNPTEKSKPMHVEVRKRYSLQRKAPACVGLLLLRQLTGVWFIFGNIPGSGGEHQFVCCHYFESNTICWPCALPHSISLSGINIW